MGGETPAREAGNGGNGSLTRPFGDGASTVSTQAVTPSHTYAQPGTYDVKLEVWADGIQHRAILTQQVSVTAPTQNQPPVARFTWSCSGTTLPHSGHWRRASLRSER